MTRILVVDNDPKELAELKRVLGSECLDWEMSFELGAEAFEATAQQGFDVVVASASSGNSAAANLLSQSSKAFPNAVRILLAEQETRQAFQELVGPAHQYLSKPCQPKMLREAVERATVLRDLLTDEKLKRIVSQVQALPTMPTIYIEILRELRTEDPSVVKLSNLISQDPGLCAKLLQLVNSPFFGLQENVSNPVEAVLYLGINAIKRLVLAIGVLTYYEIRPTVISFDRLWSHSWATGALARNLAQGEGMGEQIVEHAFLSGLLHDVGKLVLATGLPAEYPKVVQHHRRSRKPLWEAELEMLGSTHGEVGAYLLGLWGLPTPLVEAVTAHHRPTVRKEKVFSLITALHVANCLEQAKRKAEPFTFPSQMNLAYLTELGL